MRKRKECVDLEKNHKTTRRRSRGERIIKRAGDLGKKEEEEIRKRKLKTNYFYFTTSTIFCNNHVSCLLALKEIQKPLKDMFLSTEMTVQINFPSSFC
jgi:hypothetical protein